MTLEISIHPVGRTRLVIVSVPDDFDQWVGLWRVRLLHAIEEATSIELLGAAFRCAAIERLPVALRTGIDVDPTDAVIWVDGFDKASEYGGWPKLGLALEWSALQYTYKDIPAVTPEAEVEQLRRDYPHVMKSFDGTLLRLSRIPNDGAKFSYEVAYARWLPGDPFEALVATFVFHRPQDRDRHLAFIETLPKPTEAIRERHNFA